MSTATQPCAAIWAAIACRSGMALWSLERTMRLLAVIASSYLSCQCRPSPKQRAPDHSGAFAKLSVGRRRRLGRVELDHQVRLHLHRVRNFREFRQADVGGSHALGV